nr:MAG TPA: hypothetical protein [Caudoviricetes sp.]
MFDTPEGISRKTCAVFPILEKTRAEYLVPAVLLTDSYLDKFSTLVFGKFN